MKSQSQTMSADLTVEEKKERQDKAALTRAAARGAKLLDKRDPQWWSAIHTKDLQMDDGVNCVLGQLHGDYNDGLEITWKRLGSILDNPDQFLVNSLRFGFSVPAPKSALSYEALWSHLTEEWLRLIEERRRNAVAGLMKAVADPSLNDKEKA